MNVTELKMDREQARELWREYKKHQHYSEPIDDEIRRTYQLIAQGRVVIRALESIKAAGLHTIGPYASLPKLAICRADGEFVSLHMSDDGGARMERNWTGHTRGCKFDFPANTFTPMRRPFDVAYRKAALPPIPLHLRPKRAIENYHVLWEAEWKKLPPRDPLLQRRIRHVLRAQDDRLPPRG